MNYFKRAIASMSRKPGKTVILLLLVFVLGNVISGAISIRTAVLNTDSNLRASLPAIASLGWDNAGMNAYWNTHGHGPETEPLTLETIREVGNLPQVRFFNYSVQTSTFSDEFYRAVNPIYFDESDSWIVDSFDDWQAGARDRGADFISFILQGTNNSEMLEIQQGVAELVEGRLMTEAELANGESVTVVSREFALENGLGVGDTIELTTAFFDRNLASSWEAEQSHDYIVDSQTFDLTIVGLFTTTSEFGSSGDIWNTNHQKVDFDNTFFVPNSIAEAQARFMTMTQFNWSVENDMGWFNEDDFNVEDSISYTAIFYLENPAYLTSFAEDADEILPPFRIISDLSNTFGDIAGSMDTMLMIANIVLWVSVGATLVILSLLITLFLRDRKYEIGIYLALGEKKGRVISQILIEVMSVAIVAVSLSLVTGSLLSSNISQQMLHNDLQQRQEDRWQMGGWVDIPWELRMFSPGELSMEEMLEMYDTSLDGTTVAIFFGVATGTILISTLAPIMYVMRLNPKKIMM